MTLPGSDLTTAPTVEHHPKPAVVLRLLGQIYQRAHRRGLVEAEWLAEELGWTSSNTMPDESWVRGRLAELFA